MLKTNLKHLETEEDVKAVLENNQNVMICCGRMGPMCVPVYAIMEKLESKCPNVTFRDQDFAPRSVQVNQNVTLLLLFPFKHIFI